MDFVRRPVCVAFVPAENRTLYLTAKNWSEVRRMMPDHSSLNGVLIAEVPVIELRAWNSSMLLHASLGLLNHNTVAVKFDDGSRLWLLKSGVKTLLKQPKKPTAKQLAELFPYLKDAEISRLQTYNFGQHRHPFNTTYEN